MYLEVTMFERLIVLDHHGMQQFFYVPETLSINDFIENVKFQIIARKNYNSEIKKIKRQLDKEQEKLKNQNGAVMTAEQGNALIKTFVRNHPLDNRNVEDILKDSGAVELYEQIPPQNFIYDD